MYKKIIASITIALMLIPSALARIEPIYVQVDQYGIEPATWLALIVGITALINNVGRFYDKKKANSDLKYDYAYLRTTLISVLVMCMSVLQTPVVELSPYAILMAIIFGFGGNEVITRVTKVKR